MDECKPLIVGLMQVYGVAATWLDTEAGAYTRPHLFST